MKEFKGCFFNSLTTVFILDTMFVFVLVLRIQIATQESAGEAPAPTALYKLLPNKNNLCAGCGAQTLSGRLKGEENSGEARGGICPHG